jgi:sugar lactone lactonase YvrE
MSAYYHGGVRRLKVGDRILPPAITGAKSMADLTTAPDEMRAQLARVHRTDRVYLTTDPQAARMYAAFHVGGDARRGGTVYRVEPKGEIEPDPDYLPDDGGSVACPSALVVAVVETAILRAPYLEAVRLGVL